MPEYLAPGVYVEEIEIGAKPIEGVSTSTTAFIGAAKDGPILEPTLVTSWSQFESEFGGIISSPRVYLGYAVDAYFRNGGKRAYIVRVASANAAKAEYTIQNGQLLDSIVVEALSYGADGNNITITTVHSSISGDVGVFKKEVNVTNISGRDITVDDSTGFEVGDRIRVEKGTKNENATIQTITGPVITLGGDLVKNYTGTGIKLRTANISKDDWDIRLVDTSKFFPGSIIHISDKNSKADYAIVKQISGKKLLLESSISTTNDYPLDSQANPVTVESMEFNITFNKGSITESFTKLANDPRHPRFFTRIIQSQLVSVKMVEPQPTIGPNDPASNLLPQENTYSLSGGMNDDLSAVDYLAGLAPLEKVEGASLLAIPGQTSKNIQDAMIVHCERMRYRFAVLDSEPNVEPVGTNSVRTQRDNLGSAKGYGALYYPWLKCKDPVSEQLITLPPSGAVAGIYARSDSERGVHKAPANEKVSGAAGLEYVTTKGEQDVLNPEGINVIRSFLGKGSLVWGARTISADPLWKYINVRRLFIFLEESIERATQWVVFEPNNEKLWARVKQTITQSLTSVWKDGALMGTIPDEAFFVKCDRTTMTQNDIDNGRIICIIGVAPVKPAEFVIFRIAQWQGGSEVTE